MSAVNQSFRNQDMKSMQAAHSTPDPFGLLGLLSVIKMSDPDLTSLALGIDLTSLGLNLNSTENLHKTFSSPWADEPTKGDPEFTVPQCYYAKQPPALHVICSSLFLFNDCNAYRISHLLFFLGGCSKVTFQSSRWRHYFIYFIGAYLIFFWFFMAMTIKFFHLSNCDLLSLLQHAER